MGWTTPLPSWLARGTALLVESEANQLKTTEIFELCGLLGIVRNRILYSFKLASRTALSHHLVLLAYVVFIPMITTVSFGPVLIIVLYSPLQYPV